MNPTNFRSSTHSVAVRPRQRGRPDGDPPGDGLPETLLAAAVDSSPGWSPMLVSHFGNAPLGILFLDAVTTTAAAPLQDREDVGGDRAARRRRPRSGHRRAGGGRTAGQPHRPDLGTTSASTPSPTPSRAPCCSLRRPPVVAAPDDHDGAGLRLGQHEQLLLPDGPAAVRTRTGRPPAPGCPAAGADLPELGQTADGQRGQPVRRRDGRPGPAAGPAMARDGDLTPFEEAAADETLETVFARPETLDLRSSGSSLGHGQRRTLAPAVPRRGRGHRTGAAAVESVLATCWRVISATRPT